MSVDSELDAWRQEWRSDAAPLPDLSAKVRRQTRFMRMMLGAEVLVTIGIGGGSTAWAIAEREADFVWLAVACWIFIGAAWAFAMVNRRGLWAPAALDTAAFLDISIRRARAGLSAIVFGMMLYFCEILFCLGWIYHRMGRVGSIASIGVAVGTLVFVAGMVRYRRKKRDELGYLLQLRDGR